MVHMAMKIEKQLKSKGKRTFHTTPTFNSRWLRKEEKEVVEAKKEKQPHLTIKIRHLSCNTSTFWQLANFKTTIFQACNHKKISLKIRAPFILISFPKFFIQITQNFRRKINSTGKAQLATFDPRLSTYDPQTACGGRLVSPRLAQCTTMPQYTRIVHNMAENYAQHNRACAHD